MTRLQDVDQAGDILGMNRALLGPDAWPTQAPHGIVQRLPAPFHQPGDVGKTQPLTGRENTPAAGF